MAVLLLLAVPFQIIIALSNPKAVLMYFSALVTLALIAPLILYLTATPTVSIQNEGLTIHPFIGKAIEVDWEQVQSVKDYTLLPTRNHEVNRRILVGKKRYVEPAGKMLIIDGLPAHYLVAGFFAGERGRKIIAVTNRHHNDYDQLVKQIMKFTRKGKD